MDELKTKYPYITEKQWEKVSKLEASYLDFLNEVDLKAHQDAVLEAEEQARQAQIQAIIDELTSREQTPEAQLIIGGTFALQEFFFSQTGRYIGQDLMHTFIQYNEFRGLRLYVMAYEQDGKHGFNINLKYQHPSGLSFSRVVAGKGDQPENQDWSLLTNI